MTLALARVWWDYAFHVALDQRAGIATPIARGRRVAGETVSVTATEAEFRALADAAQKAGRLNTADAIRRALQPAPAGPEPSRPTRKPREKPKAVDGTQQARNAMRLMHEAGELTEAEIEAAKAKGLL